MQTSTFLQKARVFRLTWSAILSLVVLFTSLGSAISASAQTAGTSTATIRNVFVTAGASGSNTSTDTYDAIAASGGTGVGGGVFAGTNFGTYDVSVGRLVLQGGTVQITEVNGEVYDRAFIQYAVAPGTATGTNPVFTGARTIELTQTGFSGGVRTFSLSNAARDILALATVGGSTNGSNRFDITVNATGSAPDGNGGFDDIALTGARRRSIFNATGTPTTTTISANTILIAPDGNSANTYYFPNSSSTPQFPGATFVSSTNAGGASGAFDVNNGQLRLNNTTVTTTETGAATIQSVVLYYRTRLAGTAGGAFQPITLVQSGSTANGVRTFVTDLSAINTNPQPNLIATPAVTAAGNYNLDIFYQANGFNSSTGTNFSITYPPAGSAGPLTANFSVGGSPTATTIWTGSLNDNWFDPSNWSTGVPTSTTNALVRDLGAGNTVPYPNINSDAIKYSAGGTVLYDNTGSGPAKAFNLTMGGSSQASRSITRIEQGQLQVYGDFNNTYDSFIQRENTIVEFAGVNQTISGGSFVRVDISGGGIKTLAGIMNVSESLNFLTPNLYTTNAASNATPPTANPYTALNANVGVLTTDITTPNATVVVLSDRALINGNNGAQLNGETESSYLYGFVRTIRTGVLVGETRTYGNIGMTLTFTGNNNPGNVELTRNTVESYTPLNNRYSVRRIFGVRPSDPQTTTGGLQATMIFRYRDSETQNLGGPTTATYGTGSIPESSLTIFASSNSGNTFTLVGRDAVNTTTNEVTRTGVTTFATMTLGDMDNPLPVTLVGFSATREGAAARLVWATASEKNNRGFEVQVSTDGTTFRTLGFVASQSSNSTTKLDYTYTDTEAGKTGVRYYRLHQIDLTGTDSYSPVRVVSFDGGATLASEISIYPNPVAGDDIRLLIQTAEVGNARLRITDLTGRTVIDQTITTANGSTETKLAELANVKSGTYLAQLTLPSGSVKTIKVQKQ